jgi:hypothetical protein
MMMFCGTRIRYTRLPLHLIGGDLACVVEEGGDSFGCCFHGVVDLVQTTCAIGFVLQPPDQFKGLMAKTCFNNTSDRPKLIFEVHIIITSGHLTFSMSPVMNL